MVGLHDCNDKKVKDASRPTTKKEIREPQERAYVALKQAVTSKPILMLPDVNKEFVLRTDVSDIGMEPLCYRIGICKIFHVAYTSWKLQDRENKYSVMERPLYSTQAYYGEESKVCNASWHTFRLFFNFFLLIYFIAPWTQTNFLPPLTSHNDKHIVQHRIWLMSYSRQLGQ